MKGPEDDAGLTGKVAIVSGGGAAGDGTAAPGHQNFALWGFNPLTSEKNKSRDLIVGWERTLAPSGACGYNKPIVTELPVRLEEMS